jgi:phosphate starvation-inducible PhoH-like protein
MARSQRKQTREAKRSTRRGEQPVIEMMPELLIPKTEPLTPRTKKQAEYIRAIRGKTVTFGLGPAGSGKTFIATSVACEMLLNKEIDKIIVTRPAVEAGESLGFLPGELEEKYEPYLAPFRDVFHERFGKSHTEYLIKTGRIEAIPLGFMRGRTFKNALVILDEAQNATATQFKLFLTRIGENCRVIVDGDESQTDIPNSGLSDAVRRISYIPSVAVVKFGRDDIIRSGIVSEIVQAYSAS